MFRIDRMWPSRAEILERVESMGRRRERERDVGAGTVRVGGEELGPRSALEVCVTLCLVLSIPFIGMFFLLLFSGNLVPFLDYMMRV